MLTCPNCGTENPDRAKFCLECGATFTPLAADGHGACKVVTVLFADQLIARLDRDHPA